MGGWNRGVGITHEAVGNDPALDDDFRFHARVDGSSLLVDGDGEAGPTPPELLLEAVGVCSGIDVVDILRKGREEPRGLRIEISGKRRSEVPKYFERLTVRFLIQGPVSEAKARRAVDLSFERYCSVFHTLRKDLDLDVSVEIEP